MNKTTKLLLGTIVVIAIIVGVGFLTSQRPSDKGIETTKIKIADLPIINALPLYIALEKGYFKEAEIEVERVKMDSPNLIIDALLRGDVQFTAPSGALGIAGLANVKNSDTLGIYAVAGGFLDNPGDVLIVKSDGETTSVKDLKGKKIGILPGIQWRTIANEVLAQNDLKGGEDVEIVDIAPALQIASLASDQVSALLTVEPILAIAKVKGIGHELIHGPVIKAIAEPFYPGAGIYNVKFASENPEITDKILQIFARSIKEMNNNWETTRNVLEKYTALDDEIILLAPQPTIKMYNELNETDITASQKFYDIFYKHNVVDEKMDFKKMLYSSNN